MTENADTTDSLFDEIHELILAGQRDELSAAQWERFERLVCEDPRARRLYAQYALETVSLRDWAASESSGFRILEG